MKRQFLLICILIFLSGGIAFGQETRAFSRLDTGAMLIGDQVNMTIGVTYPVNSRIGWPVIPDSILSHIKVLNRSAIDSTLSQDKRSVTRKQKFLLTCFDSGFYAIPPVRFSLQQGSDTNRAYVEATPLFLKVNPVQVDTTKAIKPIKGPIRIPLTFREFFPWLLGGIAVLLAVYFIFYYLRKRRKDEPIFQLKPKIRLLPHEYAFSELEKLRARKLWQSGKIKEYHSDLTEIIRNYIEQRFQVMAMEMTSDEILEQFAGKAIISIPAREALRGVLQLADMVKFAKAQPLPAEHDKSMEKALVFVNETMIARQEVKEDAGVADPVAVT
jgi:hypothetical protein